MSTLEIIIAIGVLVNIIGWVIIVTERSRNRLVQEELLNIHRKNENQSLIQS